eukprot:scaffold7502_cov112-Isochrysis_galbana.AAC.3
MDNGSSCGSLVGECLLSCRKARLRYHGRGEVSGSWRRSGRERRAPGLLCRRSVDRSLRFTCGFFFLAPPHDDPPSLAGEGGASNSLSTKTSTLPKHVATRQGKAQGGGKKNVHLVFRGRWTIARGPSHTPFGGGRVRNLNTYRRCGALRSRSKPVHTRKLIRLKL